MGVLLMMYRRKSPFRYTFEEPVCGYFEVKQMDENSAATSRGKGKIIDVSTGGLKLRTPVSIVQMNLEAIYLSMCFKLNSEHLSFKGQIIWKRKIHSIYEYGIELITDENTEADLIQQLKIHTRKISS